MGNGIFLNIFGYLSEFRGGLRARKGIPGLVRIAGNAPAQAGRDRDARYAQRSPTRRCLQPELGVPIICILKVRIMPANSLCDCILELSRNHLSPRARGDELVLTRVH